jgi:hypothetical protein
MSARQSVLFNVLRPDGIWASWLARRFELERGG